MKRRRIAGAVALALTASMLGIVPTTAQAAPAAPAAPPASGSSTSDVSERGDKSLPLAGEETPAAGATANARQAPQAAAAGVTPPVGTVRQWIASDDAQGILYRKDYVLRGVGDHIEVWVAVDTSFPAGDCRNQIANTTVVTDSQVAGLINQFDTNIYPKETATFSTPPDRDGSNAKLGPSQTTGLGGDYTGEGDNTVALIDNVRDDNYYDFPANPTYIAGFFSSQFNDLVDRNVMTIDAFDWEHRTGANPVDAPTARSVHQPASPGQPVRGHVRARVAAPVDALHRSERGCLAQRGSVGLRADADRVGGREGDRVRQGRGQPHLLLPRLRHRADCLQPEPTGLRWSGELAEPLG